VYYLVINKVDELVALTKPSSAAKFFTAAELIFVVATTASATTTCLVIWTAKLGRLTSRLI